ncbi:MAG TPA: ABC transporter substrate-binding protein [Bradyrhizobium sp.]|nr:ABC transporter substrate-binding protein [Bradyrhizobium sp.]
MKRRDFMMALAGAAALDALPRSVSAQQKIARVIGYLHFATPDYVPGIGAFLQGIREKGYVEGENLQLEYRWAEGRYDRLPALAADLVARKVDLIVAFGPPPARAAKDATSAIPIVFEVGNDAVESGLVASLPRPGGNATGFSILFTQITPKRVDLLCELIPQAKMIVLLINPASPTAEPSIRGAREGVQSRGVQLSILEAKTESEIDVALASVSRLQGDGLVVAPDPFFNTRRAQLVDVAARHRVPTIFYEREFCEFGGLISYGSNLADASRQMGVYSGRILNGEKPADLPVVQPTNFELVINLKAAKALGLNVPERLLATANDVIE